MARGRERNFDYTPSYEETVEIAEKRATFDTLFKDVKMFRPKEGANLIRILPPTWPDRRHYGLLIRIHRNIGPRDRQYLCLKENLGSPEKRCPICDALYQLGPRATLEEKRPLQPGDAYVYYIIDRDNEKEGVQAWQASMTINSEIAAQSVNRRNKSILNITHVDHGYDVEFTRTGTTMQNTRYRGFQIMRESSPLADDNRDFDKWIDEVCDRPLPEILNFYSYDYIEGVFLGKARSETPDRDSDRLERRRSRDEDDEPRSRREAEEDDRPSRARGRDGDGERDAPRERRDDRDDAEPERRRSRNTDNNDDYDDRPRERSRDRSQLSRDLDDDIPSDGGRRARSNGREVEEEANGNGAPRRARARLGEDNGGEDTPARETRTGSGERPRRGGGEEDDINERSRQRARERLNRES